MADRFAESSNILIQSLCTTQFQNCPSPSSPRAIPGHLTHVKLRTVGNLTQNEARPVRWLSCQNVHQRSETEGFRNSLIHHVMRRVYGSFHVGFSVFVVTLYSYIEEYAFVSSVERRQAEQEIRNGWNFCRTCFQRYWSYSVYSFISWVHGVTECYMPRVISQI